MRHSGIGSRLSVTALALCALAVSGCMYLRVPRIDPTGERIFAEPPIALSPQYRAVPGTPLPEDDVEVTLCPQDVVAPVGSEVALVAGVRGADGYLHTNRRLEWSLDPAGVGHFVAVGKNGPVDLLLGDFNRPRKIDSTFAVGSTSRSYLRLDRGTATPDDDVYVLSGQGWITLTSPVEGTSHLTVFAPEVYGWANRTRAATIEWVDAQWCFPSPAINPVGTSHVFTTTVTRPSDQSPCAGWLVRYEIVDGPPAGFTPDGAAVVEVVTDSAGQARAEIAETQPASGTNHVRIQIIRPAGLIDSQTKRLVVATGATMKTWTSPELALQVTGPATAGVGTTLSYNLRVSNPGDLPASDVVVSDELPAGLTYLRSTPEAEVNGQRLRWQVGQLGPGETRTLQLDAQATQAGSLTHCADAVAAGGLKASDCAVATVASPSIDVQVTGPNKATVGSEASFDIVVTNRSQATATGLLIKDRFDPGFEHVLAQIEETTVRTIERRLDDLAPGQWQRVTVTFRVTQAGRLCHTVEVTGDDGIRASGQACLTAVEEASAQLPSPPERPSVTVRKSIVDDNGLPLGADGLLAGRNVGETVRFVIDVTNQGSQALPRLTLVDRHDAALELVDGSEGFRLDGTDLVWTIADLPPGVPKRYEVAYRCVAPAVRACNRAMVTIDGGQPVEDEACIEIRAAAPPQLTLSVADLRDPVALGGGVTYVIDVANRGTTAAHDVAVAAAVPVGMTPDRIGTSGPSNLTIEGQAVRFDPVAELPAGESLSYRVRISTRQAGEFSLRVELTSRDQPQPITDEERTEVVQ